MIELIQARLSRLRASQLARNEIARCAKATRQFSSAFRLLLLHLRLLPVLRLHCNRPRRSPWSWSFMRTEFIYTRVSTAHGARLTRLYKSDVRGVLGFVGWRGEARRGETSTLRQPCLRVYKLGSALGIFLLGQNWFFQPPPGRSVLPFLFSPSHPLSSLVAESTFHVHRTRRSSLRRALLALFTLRAALSHSLSLSLFDSPRLSLSVTPSLPLPAGRVLVPREAEREVRYDGVICQGLMCPGKREGMLVAALKSRYFRHRCYRCFLHSVSSVTINEVTDQSAAVVDDATPASLCSPWTIPRRHGFAANRFHIVRDAAPNGTEGVIVSLPRGTIHGGDFAIRDVITNPRVPSARPG